MDSQPAFPDPSLGSPVFLRALLLLGQSGFPGPTGDWGNLVPIREREAQAGVGFGLRTEAWAPPVIAIFPASVTSPASVTIGRAGRPSSVPKPRGP